MDGVGVGVGLAAAASAAQKENMVPFASGLYAREKKPMPLAESAFHASSTPKSVDVHARERQAGDSLAQNNKSKLAVRFSSNTNTPRQAGRATKEGGGGVRTPLMRTPLASIQPGQTTGARAMTTTTTTTTTTTPSSRSLVQSSKGAVGASATNANTRKNTWSGDIDIYVGGQSKERQDLQSLAMRTQRVKQDHTSASAWWGFLSSEEERGGGTGTSTTSLYKLYEWATKLVPRKGNKNNETYINLWLGYIKRQKNEEDCRDTFKMLRNMGIGERSAVLYQQWVLFEIAAGNLEKAKGIAKKGVQGGAFTKSEMETFLSRCLPTTTAVNAVDRSANASSAKRDHTHLSRLAKALEPPRANVLQQRQQVHQPVKMDDEDTSNSSRTSSSVLAPKTFCSSVYSSNTSTMQMSGTPFRNNQNHNDHPAGGSSCVSSSRASYAYTPTGTGTATVSSVTPAKAVVDLLGKAQPESGDYATPGKSAADQSLLKGPKRLGLKRFAGPARRIKPGEEAPKAQQQGNSTVTASTTATTERKPLHAVLPTPSNASNQITENYTDLTAKLSPIVEASYSTNSSSRNSTRSTSSCQTDDLAAASAASNPQSLKRSTPSASASSSEEKYVERNSGGVGGTAANGSAGVQRGSASIAAPESNQIGQGSAPVSNAAAPVQRVEVRHAQMSGSAAPQVRESSNSVTVHNVKYTVLECVGKGGSSKVFKVISPEHKIFALKRIKLEGREKEAAAGFMDEITLLKRFKGRHHIIQLVDSEILRESGLIYMVLEYGEVDLARLLQRRDKARTAEGQNKIDLNFIRLHWQQMLEAVHIIHEERIVHSDLKPANFLFVEGVLKLIDFGIAKAIQNDTTHIARESQVGTLNYMSPEAILSGNTGSRSGKQTKVGRASDVWSLGCILYQMVYGHTPFSHLQFIQKLHAITDQNHQIDFPPIQNQSLLDVMKRCLDRNPKTRIGIPDLLDHLFLNPSQESVAPSNVITPEFLNSMLMQLSKGGQSSADISKLSQELCKQLASGSVPDLSSLIPNANAQMPPPAPSGKSAGGPPQAPPPPPPPPMPASLAPQNKMKMIMDDIKKKRQLRPAGESKNDNLHGKPDAGGKRGLEGDIAAAAAAKALARSKQRQEALIALENKEKGFNDELKNALQKQHAALKPVSVSAGQENVAPPPALPVTSQNTGEDSNHAPEREEEPSTLAGALRHGLAKKFQNALQHHADDTVTMTGDFTGGSATEDTDMSWQ